MEQEGGISNQQLNVENQTKRKATACWPYDFGKPQSKIHEEAVKLSISRKGKTEQVPSDKKSRRLNIPPWQHVLI
jgi:hypothetical protein